MDSREKICVSVFKNGSDSPDKEIYTAVWIDFLNQCIREQHVLARKEIRT